MNQSRSNLVFSKSSFTRRIAMKNQAITLFTVGKRLLTPCLAVVGMMAANASEAAPFTLLSDDFSSNSQGGWIDRGLGSVDFSTGAAAITMHASNGQPTALWQTFSAVTLANTGDYIEFSADVKISNTDSRNQDVRTGLGRSFGILASSTDEEVPVDTYFATLPSNGNNTNSNVRFSNGALGDLKNVFNDGSSAALSNMGINDADSNSVNSAFKTWVWRITRNVDDDLVLSGSFNGVDFTNTVTASGANIIDGYTFDSVGLAYAYKTGETATYDNVSVVSNVPEPGSLALLAAGGMLIGTRRRRG